MSSTVNFWRENGGGAVGNGLRGPCLFAGHVALRNGPLFDRPYRLTGHAIEHVKEAGLAGQRHRVDRLAILPDGDQLRSRGVVIIPEIVVHGLVVPQALAGARVERQQAVAEQVATRCGRRRRNRKSSIRWAGKRCRASHRGSVRPRCWRHRDISGHPWESCRRRIHRAAARYETARPVCR